jgi:hypothetical protein
MAPKWGGDPGDDQQVEDLVVAAVRRCGVGAAQPIGGGIDANQFSRVVNFLAPTSCWRTAEPIPLESVQSPPRRFAGRAAVTST